MYCKPKYRAILFKIIYSSILFYLIVVISAVGIGVPSIFYVLILVHTDQNFLFISVLDTDMLPANQVPSREETVPSVMDTTPGMLSKQYISCYYFPMNLMSYIPVNIMSQ